MTTSSLSFGGCHLSSLPALPLPPLVPRSRSPPLILLLYTSKPYLSQFFFHLFVFLCQLFFLQICFFVSLNLPLSFLFLLLLSPCRLFFSVLLFPTLCSFINVSYIYLAVSLLLFLLVNTISLPLAISLPFHCHKLSYFVSLYN